MILIIEKDTQISNFFSKELAHDPLDIAITKNIESAEELIQNNSNKIKAVLFDIDNIPANVEEVVEGLINFGLSVIVFTSEINEEFRQQIMKYPIIDYVYKERLENLRYVANLIRRLVSEKQISVLVVDDSRTSRMNIALTLSKFKYKIFQAENGKKALWTIEKTPNIQLVITDHEMPEMNGLEFVKELRKKHTREDIAILVVSGQTKTFSNAEYLKFGANDILKKPYVEEELTHKVLLHLELLDYVKKSKDMAERDYLTKLYNRRYFFEKVTPFFSEEHKHEKNYALCMLDLDDFKKINDQFGHLAGDLVIQDFSKLLSDMGCKHSYIARIGGEEFAVFTNNSTSNQILEMAEILRKKTEQQTVYFNTHEIKYTVSIGCTTEKKKSFEEMLHNADTKLYEAKKAGKNRVVK
ncbi:MAG: diguanylate cyclase [Spirochaetales bacterium]|nr:diguanylate cyclase [Spirochaetales bacterium]